MHEPVVLSSGAVLDRSSVLGSNGNLRFKNCPYTREPLEEKVYPMLRLREVLVSYGQGRVKQLFDLIQVLSQKVRILSLFPLQLS